MSDNVTDTGVSDDLFAFIAKIEGVPSSKLAGRFPGEFQSYRAMRARERRGTAMVDAALRTFAGFLSCLGPRPYLSATVDRIDNANRRYEPGNVQWASKTEQANNRSNTKFLRGKDGRARPLTEWARLTAQKPDTMRKRSDRDWSDDEVITGVRKKPAVSTRKAPKADESVEKLWPVEVAGYADDWERWWLAWNKLWGSGASTTRAVFFVWVATNRARLYEKQLAERYPDYIGETANPELEITDTIKDDATYLRLMALREPKAFMRSHMVGKVDETRLLGDLLRRFPRVVSLEAAAKTDRPRSESD